MVYTICGKCSVYYASRVNVFFEKSFRVPKIVPNSAVSNVVLYLMITLLANCQEILYSSIFF